MRHSNTELLIDYWQARKVGRQSPLRSSIDPSEITELLPQVFILGRTAPGQFVFRLAGALLTRLHARDLRRLDFASLFTAADRQAITTTLETARRAAEPAVLSIEARAEEGLSAQLEILLAPLRAPTLPPDRVLGLYQLLTPLAGLRDKPVRELRVAGLDAAAGGPGLPVLRLAALDGRRIA